MLKFLVLSIGARLLHTDAVGLIRSWRDSHDAIAVLEVVLLLLLPCSWSIESIWSILYCVILCVFCSWEIELLELELVLYVKHVEAVD